MTVISPKYHWEADHFLMAFEAGAFPGRVELVDGEVWPVVIGEWHGDQGNSVNALLHSFGERASTGTLASGTSLPDPDCWVRRSDAIPTGMVGNRLPRWDPKDVLLVVEISDSTVLADLNIKARLYGSAGYPVYWVITKDVVYVHTDPHSQGYATRKEYRAGAQLPISYADAYIDPALLFGP